MNFDLSPKQDDPQRLLKLNGVPREFWLSAEEINLIIRAIKQLLGEDDSLYKGEFPVLPALEFEHPNPDPGSYAQIEGDPNQEAIWDNTNFKWVISGIWEPTQSAVESIRYFENFAAFPNQGFEDELYLDKEEANIYIWDDFEELYILASGSGGAVSKQYVDAIVENALQEAKAYTDSLSGASSSPQLYSFYAAHQQNLDYRVTGHFSFPEEGNFGSVENPIVQYLSLSPGDATYDRIDMIVANSQGNFEVIAGTPAANPEEPNYDLATQIRCTIIFVAANATTPVNKTETIVYAEGGAAEFNTAIHYPTGMGNSLNVASSSAPISGTVSIEGTDVATYQAINFIPDSPIPVAEVTGFEYLLKNKNIPNQPTHRIQVDGKKSNGQDIISFLNAAERHGYDPQDLTAQKIALPFTVSSQMVEITRIRFVVYCDTTINWGFWLDDVKLIGGEEAPVPTAYVTRDEMDAAIAELDDTRLSNLANDLSTAEKLSIKNKLSLPPLEVNASRNLAATDNGRKLYVTVNSTLTYPTAGLGADFECNIVTALTITATIAGTTLLAPNGTILTENQMGHCFVEPINNKLSLNGGFSE